MARSLLVILLLARFGTGAWAADIPLGFEDPATERAYQQLLEELRCLVCQNQSVADSHADLAQDLRNEVHRMLAEGRSPEDIKAFMVARYGDFVLYRPPVKASTWTLWLAPPALLLVMGLAWWRLQRRAGREETTAALSDEEARRLAQLLPRIDDGRDQR